MNVPFRRIAPMGMMVFSLLLLGAPGAGADLDLEEAYPLPWASLDRLFFFVDITSFPTDSTVSRTEVYIRLPGNALAYVDTGMGGGDFRYKVKLKNFEGKKVFEVENDVHVPPSERDETGFSPGHVVLVTAPLEPGWHEAEIELKDLNTQKIGLAYLGRKVHEEGKVKGIFFVPTFPQNELVLSELEPAWSISPAERRSSFTRGSVDVFPNPSRTYGLYQNEVRIYYELASGSEGFREITLTPRVLTVDGDPILTVDPSRMAIEGRTWSQAQFNVSGLPSGAYDVEVLLEEEGSEPVRRMTRINVAWSRRTWMGDPRMPVNEVHFLTDDEEQERAFTRMSLGEQEAYLIAYWRARDPDPTTPRNEARERFYRRVQYANQRYGTKGVEQGMFSDRGRTYIRYGPPDEIIQEVMPTSGLQVEDIARQIGEEEGLEFAAPLQGRGTIGADIRSYEIWRYDRLFNVSDVEEQDVGPRRPMERIFIFVDEEGYGNFVLRYSND